MGSAGSAALWHTLAGTPPALMQKQPTLSSTQRSLSWGQTKRSSLHVRWAATGPCLPASGCSWSTFRASAAAAWSTRVCLTTQWAPFLCGLLAASTVTRRCGSSPMSMGSPPFSRTSYGTRLASFTCPASLHRACLKQSSGSSEAADVSELCYRHATLGAPLASQGLAWKQP